MDGMLNNDVGFSQLLSSSLEAIAQLEATQMSLEALYDNVTGIKARGGMCPQTAAFSELAFKQITAGIELETNFPAMESFGGIYSKGTATEMSLESMESAFKQLWEMMKKIWSALITKLKEYYPKFKQQLEKSFDVLEDGLDKLTDKPARNTFSFDNERVASTLLYQNRIEPIATAMSRFEKSCDICEEFLDIAKDVDKDPDGKEFIRTAFLNPSDAYVDKLNKFTQRVRDRIVSVGKKYGHSKTLDGTPAYVMDMAPGWKTICLYVSDRNIELLPRREIPEKVSFKGTVPMPSKNDFKNLVSRYKECLNRIESMMSSNVEIINSQYRGAEIPTDFNASQQYREALRDAKIAVIDSYMCVTHFLDFLRGSAIPLQLTIHDMMRSYSSAES